MCVTGRDSRRGKNKAMAGVMMIMPRPETAERCSQLHAAREPGLRVRTLS